MCPAGANISRLPSSRWSLGREVRPARELIGGARQVMIWGLCRHRQTFTNCSLAFSALSWHSPTPRQPTFQLSMRDIPNLSLLPETWCYFFCLKCLWIRESLFSDGRPSPGKLLLNLLNPAQKLLPTITHSYCLPRAGRYSEALTHVHSVVFKV